MKRQSVQNFISNYSRAFGLKTLLIEQQYSMRSYETGLYDIRSDGNLRSIINIINELDLEAITKIDITIPLFDQMKNGHDDAEWLRNEFFEEIRPRLMFVPTQYGVNALANRKENVAYFGRDVGDIVLTYFDIKDRDHTIFICPGSPRPENPLYSMDEAPWFEKQISEAVATFFFNQNQNIYPDIYYEKMFEITNFVRKPDLDEAKPHYDQFEFIDLYFPYRLTDEDYGFEALAYAYPEAIIGVTDPNNSLEKLPYFDDIKNRVVKLDPKKHKDYLLTIAANRKTRIYMPSDLTKTIHMGPIEILSIFWNKRAKLLFPLIWGYDKIDQIWKEAERALI
ncbi:hypothetical protein EVB55_139 [Rhizobium phage RHph_Y68]|uniref:Uncharacterized protein n=1 Tax=Rhizobium phage RHph_Y68 TaxID=2509787 RepID=A0A7S5R977_9CAUD|nr:hypothetical protein PP934_gp139 [Rhizobium phage RHph_Y68]QIG68074.1 hypothetical protein EVB55_139 [Rhizobium phage RHph_Y68]